MRIVSLLPALTELVCELGCRDELVGVTHECDFPPGVETLPHVTSSRIPGAATSSAIDAMVAEQGGSLYELDAALLERLQPDLILTQTQCDVCAVNEQTVRRCASGLAGNPHVESVNPTSLAEVHAMFRRVGELLRSPGNADALVDSFHATASWIAQQRQGVRRPRVVLLEWLDPPFSSGHWNPEIVALAGGNEVIARPGARSRRLTWDQIQGADPEVVILSPCGFTLERSVAELPRLLARAEWKALSAVRSGRVVLADGAAYFSSPGHRLEASLRIAAAAIDPDRCADLAPRSGWRTLTPTP